MKKIISVITFVLLTVNMFNIRYIYSFPDIYYNNNLYNIYVIVMGILLALFSWLLLRNDGKTTDDNKLNITIKEYKRLFQKKK